MKQTRAYLLLLSVLIFLVFPEIIQAGCAFGRGKPQSECSGWIVINSAWLQRFAGNVESEYKSRFLLNGELGYMKNVSPSQAVGGSLYLSGDDDGSNFGFMARYKKFLNKTISYDFCAGILLAGDDNYIDKKFPGFVFQSAISVKDWIAIMLQAQFNRYDVNNYVYDINDSYWNRYSGTQSEFYLGLRFGSYAAFVVPVAVAVIVAATFNDFDVNY